VLPPSPADTPPIPASDGTLVPGPQTTEISSWLDAGGPFYLLGLGSNEKLHWVNTVSCGGRLQFPDGWNVSPFVPGYDYGHPGNFPELIRYSSISAVSLHCWVIQGNVKVEFSGYSVPLSPGFPPEIVDYHTVYNYSYATDTATQYVYWHYNAPGSVGTKRNTFNGTVSGSGQDCTASLDIALPETLDVQFTSLNTDANQPPQDCIVAFMLDLYVDEFHMRDYLLNVDGSLNTEFYGESGAIYSIGKTRDPNNNIGVRATILRGSGLSGPPDLGQDPTQKLDDFGQKLTGLKDHFHFDSLGNDLGSGDDWPLFSVTALVLPGIKIKASSGNMDTPEIALVDDFTWDSAHLKALGLDWALLTFRALVLFMFVYYCILRFWRAFNH